MREERGEALLEVVVAVSIAAIALAALLAGVIAATHRFGPDPAREALLGALQREMRIAVDVMKYQGGSIAPTAIATTIPMPGASPAAVHMSIAATTLPSGTTSIALQATLDSNPTETASLSTTIDEPAPVPSSTIFVNGGAPQ